MVCSCTFYLKKVRVILALSSWAWMFGIACFAETPAKKDGTVASLKKLTPAVFKILVESQEPDLVAPWKKNAPERSSGSGFYVGNNRIVTNAHVVEYATHVQVQRDGEPPLSARVLHIAYDVDLALLEVQSPPPAFASITPMEFEHDLLDAETPVFVLGYPMGGTQLSVSKGVISRYEFRDYVLSRARHLVLQTDAAINPGNSGGPAVGSSGKLIGVAFQGLEGGEGLNFLIPMVVVERFFKDIQDGHYDGTPCLGVEIQEDAMQNQSMKLFHGLSKDADEGVLVSYVASYGSAAQKLFPGDVLLAMDGLPIKTTGEVSLFGKKIHFLAAVDLKNIGDEVLFDVFRAEKKQVVTIKTALAATHPVDEKRHLPQRDYLVFAGMVFEELDGNTKSVDTLTRVSYSLAFYDKYLPEWGERKALVFVPTLLRHPINQDQPPVLGQVLISVNGRAMQDLDELRRFLGSSTEQKLEFRFFGQDLPLIFDRDQVLRANGEIENTYGIPSHLGRKRS